MKCENWKKAEWNKIENRVKQRFLELLKDFILWDFFYFVRIDFTYLYVFEVSYTL